MSTEHPARHRLNPVQLRQLAAAEAALRSGNPSRAAGLAKEIATRAPHAADAWHLWALALARAGKHEAACTRFRHALDLTPENAALLANFATALRRAGQPEDAVEMWQRALRVRPDFGQAWLDLGLTELDRDRPGPACQALQRAIECMPANGPAWHGLGNALDALGQVTEAEHAFRKALECDPSQAAVWINLGHVLRRQTQLDQAMHCYAQARRTGGNTPHVLDAQAGTLLDMGRTEEAAAMARRLTATYPQFAPGQRTLAQILWEHDRVAESGSSPLAGFADAVETHPDDANLRLAYALLLRQTGQAEAALEHITYLRAREDHPAFRRAQADTLEALDRSADAAPLYHDLYRQAQHRDPAFLNAYTRHCLKSGQWQRAEALADEALTRDPQNQEAWAYRATAWRLLGDAREYWLCDYERLVTLVEVEPPLGDASAPERTFLPALEKTLLSLHQASRQPVQQSLRHGTQTAGNLFGRSDPALRALKQAILQVTGDWIATLPLDPAHPFLRRKGQALRLCGSWSVKLTGMGHHVNHIHPQGWISSAFYVSLPEVMRDERDHAGCIQFGQPPLDLGLDLPARRVIRPRQGFVALFPSFMWHGTVPFQDVAPRLTVACDISGT